MTRTAAVCAPNTCAGFEKWQNRRQPASAINPAPRPYSAPAMRGLNGNARATSQPETASAGSALRMVAPKQTRQTNPRAGGVTRVELDDHVIQVIVMTAMAAVPSARPSARRDSVVPGTASRKASATSVSPSIICSVDAPQVRHEPEAGASARKAEHDDRRHEQSNRQRKDGDQALPWGRQRPDRAQIVRRLPRADPAERPVDRQRSPYRLRRVSASPSS